MLKKLVPDLFLKNQNRTYLWIESLTFYRICFYGMSKSRNTNISSNYDADHLLLTHIRRFQKTNRGLQLVSLPHFPHDFWRKMFLTSYSIKWPNFIDCLPLILETLDNICFAFIYFSVYDVTNFEILPSLFPTWPKSQAKH